MEEFSIGRIKKKKDYNVLMENDISMGVKFNRIIFINFKKFLFEGLLIKCREILVC